MVTVREMSLFFALLAVATQLLVATTLILSLGSRPSSALAGAWRGFRREVAPNALWLAAAIAAVAMAGSLYLSEGAHLPPCELCWYQRIAMYPLVPILAVAAWRRDRAIAIPAVVLAAIGLVIAGYHVVIEWFPSLDAGSCDPTNPCTVVWFRRFGYLTIPAMAASGFAAILTLFALAPSREGAH